MKRSKNAFGQMIFIVPEETLKRRDALQDRLKELSLFKATISTALLFDIALCALAREVALDPVQSVRLFVPKETDYIRVININGVSHYYAYQIVKGVDTSATPKKRRAKIAGQGVYPYPVKEGWYKTK